MNQQQIRQRYADRADGLEKDYLLFKLNLKMEVFKDGK